jgi:hypothetical protein
MTGAANDELALQDRVRVETDLNGRRLALRAVIVKVCAAELWLGLAAPDHRLEALRPDQSLQLTVARRDSALLGESGFLRPLGGSKSRVFAVVRPPCLERVQRRAHIRYDIDMPLTFRHIDPGTRELRGRGMRGITMSVGSGGLLFCSEAEVLVGQELDITVPLSSIDRINTMGVVTRFRTQPGPLAVSEIAVKLTRITSADQDRFVRFILAAEHRRRQAVGHTAPPPALA